MPAFDFEGIDIGTDSSEVDAAFAKALGRETDTQEPTDEVTPGEQPAAEEEQEGQPRNAQGQFAPKPFESESEELEEEEAPAEEHEQGDEVSQFLARYGGDADKALRAAVELDRLRGRQGDELGQLRQEVAQLREQVVQPAQQPQQQYVPITEQVVDELDALALENGHAALQRVAQLGDPTGQLTERVMDIWFSANPRQASAFQAAFIAQQTEQRVRAELEPIVNDRTANAEEQAAVEAWTIAASKFEGINELAPAMKEVFDARPGLARAAASAESVEELADVYVTAAELAAARSGAATSQVAQIAEQQAKATLTQAKKHAAVVRPSAVGSQPGATDDKPTESDRIKAGITGANSTSILDGWTTG